MYNLHIHTYLDTGAIYIYKYDMTVYCHPVLWCITIIHRLEILGHFLQWYFHKNTLPETNSWHLKMDGWNTIVSFWDGLFSGAFAVSLGEGNYSVICLRFLLHSARTHLSWNMCPRLRLISGYKISLVFYHGRSTYPPIKTYPPQK